MIVLYLAAVVAANLLISTYGAAMAIPVAFTLIALDLSTRDALHERWHGRHLWRNMAGLILAGSILSAALNVNALPIAVASFAAFAAAGVADTVTYTLLGKYTRLFKMNGSNAVSAAVDSLVFLVLAFGWPPLWSIVLAQFAAKVIGGFVWSLVLEYWRTRRLAFKAA
jgi:uncharacterized PurR-regulated membrane protein YhhQ (DUF165 family)